VSDGVVLLNGKSTAKRAEEESKARTTAGYNIINVTLSQVTPDGREALEVLGRSSALALAIVGEDPDNWFAFVRECHGAATTNLAAVAAAEAKS
jgi:hypothetical protein